MCRNSAFGIHDSGFRIRRLRGVAVYGWALARTLRDLRSPRVTVSADGIPVADEPLLLTTVGNGACHGGGFWLCPEAAIDDGQLDVLIARSLSLAGALRLLPRVLRGTHLGDPAVQLHHARHVHIHAAEPLPIHADGEIVASGVREMEIELLPGRLRVLS